MFKTITKAQIFTAAWAYARQGAAQFGGKVRDYFAAALRTSYEMARQAEAINLAAVAVAKPVVASTIDKLTFLAGQLFTQRAYAKGSFAASFIGDNAMRLNRFGTSTKFSDKQVAIIDKLYAEAH